MTEIRIKRGENWANQTLECGELGLDLTNMIVRIGTEDNQSFSNAPILNRIDADYGDLDV